MTTINNDQGAQLKAEAIAARRAARAPWQNAHVDRIIQEREARETAKEYRRVEREAQATKHCSKCNRRLPATAFGRQSCCKPCAAAYARERYYRLKGGIAAPSRGPISPEQQQEAAERIAHLTDLLTSTSPRERISSEQGWDMTTSELERLWGISGDKVCMACKAVVPPSAMMPPGPANFYPGQCRSCARSTYQANSMRAFGKLSEPTLLPLRDGSRITLAEFARRVEARHAARINQRS